MNNPSKKGVGFFRHTPSGCFWYRIKHPMEALKRAGVRTEMIDLDKDVELDNLQSLQVYGIYPFSFDKALRYVKNEGKHIIYDIDDATDFIEPTNPFYYSVRKDSNSQREIFALADHITVATPFLAEYVMRRTDKPVTIIPNCYDPAEWGFERKNRGGMRIGFAGSCTHIEDLLLVLPAIKNLQKRYDITFVIMGFAITDYDTWLTQFRFVSPPEALKAIDTFESLMKDIKFEWVPYTDFENYPKQLTELSLNIGLCPLTDTPFNRARSASKAMEYTLSGALALASDLEPYRNDDSSVLTTDWEYMLEHYITNPHLITQDHSIALNWIQQNRNIDSQVDLLKSVYIVE